MKRVIAVLAIVPSLAFAQDFGGFQGSFNGNNFSGPVNVNAATGNNPIGTPNVANGGAGGAGGLGGTGLGGMGGSSSALGGVSSASANGSVNVSGDANKAYALGMSSLTSSANACQGSAAIAFFAFSYTVRFCELMQKAIVMGGAKFDTRSIQNVMCLDPDIAQSASECAGVK